MRPEELTALTNKYRAKMEELTADHHAKLRRIDRWEKIAKWAIVIISVIFIFGPLVIAVLR